MNFLIQRPLQNGIIIEINSGERIPLEELHKKGEKEDV